VRHLILSAILAVTVIACVPKEEIYRLKGEEPVFQQLGWQYASANENTGAARTFQAFVRTLRSPEPERAVDFLAAGQTLDGVLKARPCLRDGQVRAFDPNTGLGSRHTVLRVRCGNVEFKVLADMYEERGWVFDFRQGAGSAEIKKIH
jgi:hypothetical protein